MRVAIAQATSAWLDLQGSVDRAIAWIERAALHEVSFVAFGEAFIGGYPIWVDWPGYSEFQSRDNAKLYTRLLEASLTLDSPELESLQEACKVNSIAAMIGANLRSRSRKSIYNALLTIDHTGELLQIRRKLMPTHGERLCWAQAPDATAADVRSVVVQHADKELQVGGLMCWEHWMPAARQRMHEHGETLHVAAWPSCSELHHLASRHYAFEASSFVLATALVAKPSDLPDLGIEIPERFDGMHGGSAIISPSSQFIEGPIVDQEQLLVADIDLREACDAAFLLDTGGHYSRAWL